MNKDKDHNIQNSDDQAKSDGHINLIDRVLNSASNLVPSLGSLSVFDGSSFSAEKGTSAVHPTKTEPTQSLSILSELRASSGCSSAQNSFSSRKDEDFDPCCESSEVYSFPHLETLHSDQAKGRTNFSLTQLYSPFKLGHSFTSSDCMTEATNQETTEKYRDLAKDKHSKAETFNNKGFGYFDGEFLSSEEVYKNLNAQHLNKQNSLPNYPHAVSRSEFIEDGHDVIQLLNEPINEDEFIDGHAHASQLLAQEEQSFKVLLKRKYGYPEKAPKTNIIHYLETLDYLEDVYGLPEFSEKLSGSFKPPSISAEYKKALERLVLIKHHLSDF